VNYSGHDVPVLAAVKLHNVHDLQLNQAVVKQNPRTYINVVGEPAVGNRNVIYVTLNVLGGQRKRLLVSQGNFTVLESLDADFGAVRIQKRGNRQVQLLADSLNLFKGCPVAAVVAVRKILPRNVHAAFHELAQHFIACRCGP
jgi:hypothetical protein